MNQAVTREEWITKIRDQVVGAGAMFEEWPRAVLARLTREELATVHLMLVLVRDPIARRYQRQRLLNTSVIDRGSGRKRPTRSKRLTPGRSR